jgi:DNA-binding NtrC family response regulator
VNEHASQKVLIVDDEERIRSILKTILADEGYEVQTARDGIEGLQLAKAFGPEVVIIDLQMPRMDGIETIVRIRAAVPGTVPVILTAHGSIESAVEAIKKGAYDYLTKPFDNDQLLLVVRRAAERARLSREVRELRRQVDGVCSIEDLLGESSEMRSVRQQLARIAEVDATVLIEGESGTGKELAARAIHNASRRQTGPFIVIDCTAIPSSLIESTFFGHEKGAFTDAHERRPGKFEEANGGTAFLDEIGELPHDAQAKLLRVLQEHEFTRVGGTAPIRVDVRVVAATNKDLAGEVNEGRFREDLFYRLNVLKLEMPPLRTHPVDVPALARNFITRHRALLGSQVMDISAEALSVLASYRWPGNVREMENTIQRTMLLAHGTKIEASDLRQMEWAQRGEPDSEGLEAQVKKLAAEAERGMILRALDATGWNRTAAAELLKVSRKTLFNKMQLYGIGEEAKR